MKIYYKNESHREAYCQQFYGMFSRWPFRINSPRAHQDIEQEQVRILYSVCYSWMFFYAYWKVFFSPSFFLSIFFGGGVNYTAIVKTKYIIYHGSRSRLTCLT